MMCVCGGEHAYDGVCVEGRDQAAGAGSFLLSCGSPEWGSRLCSRCLYPGEPAHQSAIQIPGGECLMLQVRFKLE